MTDFDFCLITASSEKQAADFRALLRRRIDHGLYPREVGFYVFPDPEKGRIGSGGGTLLALSRFYDEARRRGLPGSESPASFFARHRILLLHAGGESRRLPCYAPEGKLFAPVPVDTSSILPPVILDMQLSLFFRFPWRRGEVVIASGDVIIDFDCDRIPLDRGDICGFAKPASPEQGSRHGVFQFDAQKRRVVDFHQKQSPDFLTRTALIEGTRECGLDMGIVALSPAFVDRFLAFGKEGGPQSVEARLARGEVKFDLYFEVMTACLQGMDEESFLLRLKDQSRLSPELQQRLHLYLHGFDLEARVTAKTSFLHFGTLSEFPEACRDMVHKGFRPFYDAESGEIAAEAGPDSLVFNAVETRSGPVPGGFFGENLHNCSLPPVPGALFIGLRDFSFLGARRDGGGGLFFPPGLCLDERREAGSTFRLVYGASDSFRPEKSLQGLTLCGIPLPRWLEERGLSPSDLWDEGEAFDLLTARLYPPLEGSLAGEAYLSGYWWEGRRDEATAGREPSGEEPARPSLPSSFLFEWGRAFKALPRRSLKSLNESADVLARDLERTALRKTLLREVVLRKTGWRHASLPDLEEAFSHPQDWPSLKEIYAGTDDPLLKAYRRRHLTALIGPVFDEPAAEIDFLGAASGAAPLSLAVKQDQIVWARSPVRLDLAGGWSDTPPYTLRYGGAVVNVAVDLNGQPPIQVFCRRTGERFIRIHSIDLGVTETVTDFAALADFRNPTSPFALPKAALTLIGLRPDDPASPASPAWPPSAPDSASLPSILDALGSGLEITLLSAVPKGSGLGTSSILGATILAALHRFFGLGVSQDELFGQVLQMEQLLTTGGGWQDQIGGVVGGVKYIESKAGLNPSPIIHQLDPFLFEDPQVRRHFTLFYTGITRLAKNILENVVDRFNAGEPAYLFTLEKVRRNAFRLREAIGLRSLPGLAESLQSTWQSKVRIHPGSSNEEVERLFRETRPHCSAASLLGAGGGGYALFLSADEKEAEVLRDLLRRRFESEKARIVDCSLNPQGLRVTTS